MFSRAPTALNVSCIDVWEKGGEGARQGDGFGGVMKVLNPLVPLHLSSLTKQSKKSLGLSNISLRYRSLSARNKHILNTYQTTLVVTKTQNKAKQELVQGTKRGKDATRFFFTVSNCCHNSPSPHDHVRAPKNHQDSVTLYVTLEYLFSTSE
jgi:hypothetical protein